MKVKSAVSIEFTAINLNGKTVDLTVRGGVIESISAAPGPAAKVILPLPVDPHVHLDKTFTAGRCMSRKPGLFGAIEAMEADLPNWTEEDLRGRIGRAFVEAHEHGVRAMRSHVDWQFEVEPLAWGVLGEMAQDWRGKLEVQRASLTPLDLLGEPSFGAEIAKKVAADGEVLGCFVYRNDNLGERLNHVFDLAAKHELRLDFHVDEGLDAEADAFDWIVALTKRYGMAGRVLCGHACSLSIRPAADVSRVIDAAADAGIALTVLPTTNLWLQDAEHGVTPRKRGLAPMHELRAAGVPVLLGADNVADPFYPMGVYDMLDVLRTASFAAHLIPGDWLDAITSAPARALGIEAPEIKVGAPADFILVDGHDWEDALRKPRALRQVLRAGQIQCERKEAA
jgi:cytosine deaminase